MEAVIAFLETCRVGKKQVGGNLTMFPLLSSKNVEPDYLTLAEALEKGVLTVTEVSESGEVNRVKVYNRGTRPVLLIEGEELQGAGSSGTTFCVRVATIRSVYTLSVPSFLLRRVCIRSPAKRRCW